MTAVHVGLGIAALALNLAAGGFGAWCWWRAQQSAWFWRLLRAGQVSIVLEAILGGVLQLGHHKAPGIHVLYGLLPLAVSFVAEQLRVASAQMIMDSRGFESTAEVAELPGDEQRGLVVAIVQREVGVMALAALVIVVLLARAAGTY
jgi:drug/metabolite transporter superfamily protein YnfA